MHGKDRTFTFVLTGIKDNDSLVENCVRTNTNGYAKVRCIHYKFEYTPPYQKFTGIACLERATQYRPFRDSNQKNAVVIIDLSEWIAAILHVIEI